MKLREQLNMHFIRQMVRTPDGRAHVLSQVADAESTGESRLFDHVLAHVDDPALARMVRKHRDDELRHERLFRSCLARAGSDRVAPPGLRLMDRLDRALGGFLARPVTDARGVMESYLLLQVLEERAVAHFRDFAAAFDEVDRETADTFRQVQQDELRHVRYCEAIARRYAPSEDERRATFARLRAVEAQVFEANQLDNMRHVLRSGFVRGAAWRALFVLASSSAALRGSSPGARLAYDPAALGFAGG